MRIEGTPDMPDPKSEHHLTSEQAYRRGYYQGYFMAVKSIEDGCSIKKCFDFLHDKLLYWRYERPLKGILFPPEIPRRKEGKKQP